MHVVATAGHVDHGKSTLVRALTGMEPDRWAEERRRGMTIDLGFAWTSLPSGEDIAFVDVPGHHRFVSNMLAGVGAVPAVLFVVAADEGWSRQSAEHLAALDALDVRHGVLAVTRADLTDPAAAIDESLHELRGSSLAHAQAVAVSGVTGAGLPELHAALDAVIARLPRPEPAARVRLWIDRVFTIRGSGTVVTGTLPAGTIRVDDELETTDGRVVRVRALQTLKRSVTEVGGVARVAVNLRGVDPDELERGHALLTPQAWHRTATVDVRLHNADAATGSVVLHVGSAAVSTRVRALGVDTARLTLSQPLPLQIGDRAVLRDPGEQRIVAGVVMLDVAPPELARRGAAAERAQILQQLEGTPDVALEVALRRVVRRADVVAYGAAVPASLSGVREVGEWLVAHDEWEHWQRALLEVVQLHAQRDPLAAGLPFEAARQRIGVPDGRLFDALVSDTAGVTAEDGVLRPGGADYELPVDVSDAVATLRTSLTSTPFVAPEAGELAALGLDQKALAAAVRHDLLMRVGESIYLLPHTDEQAVRVLARLPQPFTTSEARQALGTTRRVAIPLLEYLDATGRTRRVDGDHREIRIEEAPQ